MTDSHVPKGRDDPIDPALRRRLATHPDQLQNVSVWFTELPDPAELSRLGLAAVTVNPVVGAVDARRAEVLARRADVISVVLEPESRPFGGGASF